MHIVHVHIHIKPEFIEAFKTASLDNARSSIQEPGFVRFDVIQQVDDPTHFELIEVYRTLEDTVKHKETEHYIKWRDLAEPIMSEPRTRTIYLNLFPADEDW
jgi:quinol monooxygenase YgiN